MATTPLDLYLQQLSAPAAARALAVLGRLSALLGGGGTPTSLPWHQLSPEQAAALRLWATLFHATATANAMLTALRGVLRWAARAGQLDAEEGRAVVRRLGRVRGGARSHVGIGRPLARRRLQAILDVCDLDEGDAGPRDAALIALMIANGLTAPAAARLDWRDFDRERGVVLAATGRRGRVALLIEGSAAEARLIAWLHARETPEGPAFPNARSDRPLTPAGVTAILRRRARQAGAGNLTAADLAAAYRWEVGRAISREPSRPPCSLLYLEDGGVCLATPALDLQPSADPAVAGARRVG